MALYALPKFIPFRSVINFLRRSAFWDLADFWPIFRLSERPKVHAFIAQKLNKLRRPFFIFPDNFCCSIRIWKNIPSGGHGSGATAPQNRFQKPKFQNFALFREATHCAQMLCASGSEPVLFCTPRGPLVSVPTHLLATS